MTPDAREDRLEWADGCLVPAILHPRWSGFVGELLLPILPWILAGLYLAFGIRLPRPLPSPRPSGSPGEEALPPVSIVVPARNEEHNIGACVTSLAAQDYPDFEILVVDDRSEDRTAEIVRGLPKGRARSIRLIDGAPLPPGWFGKPWACHQGAQAATGSLLLFTDADTIHEADLLARSVRALEEDQAGAVTLLGRQIMETFWERVIQPQIFTLIGMRYGDLRAPRGERQWKHAIANGQYILVRRSAWEAIGGHEAVRNEVVEDLRLAQELARGGHPVSVRRADREFATRMYRNLHELIEGWMKNLATGSRQSLPVLGALAVPGIVGTLLGLWVLPPIVLALSLLGVPGLENAWGWSGFATLSGLLIWTGGAIRMHAPARYGLTFPLGAAMSAWIILRSGLRGSRRIEWKGRSYAPGG